MHIAFRGHVSSERLMHMGLCCAQGVLAAIFAAMALLKLLSEPDRLVEIMAWTADSPRWFVFWLASAELLGAFFVAAPVVTSTPQRIVGFTATAFCTLMGAATLLHLYRSEWRMVPVTLAIGGLAALVAWGRLTHKPLETLESYDPKL